MRAEEVIDWRAFPSSKLSRNGDTLGCGGADMGVADMQNLRVQAEEESYKLCADICSRLQPTNPQESCPSPDTKCALRRCLLQS